MLPALLGQDDVRPGHPGQTGPAASMLSALLGQNDEPPSSPMSMVASVLQCCLPFSGRTTRARSTSSSRPSTSFNTACPSRAGRLDDSKFPLLTTFCFNAACPSRAGRPSRRYIRGTGCRAGFNAACPSRAGRLASGSRCKLCAHSASMLPALLGQDDAKACATTSEADIASMLPALLGQDDGAFLRHILHDHEVASMLPARLGQDDQRSPARVRRTRSCFNAACPSRAGRQLHARRH